MSEIRPCIRVPWTCSLLCCQNNTAVESSTSNCKNPAVGQREGFAVPSALRQAAWQPSAWWELSPTEYKRVCRPYILFQKSLGRHRNSLLQIVAAVVMNSLFFSLSIKVRSPMNRKLKTIEKIEPCLAFFFFTSVSYSGGLCFESRPRLLFSWVFMVFLIFSRHFTG